MPRPGIEGKHQSNRVMDLQNKVVIVTGASAGLGADFAAGLVAKGARVYGLARRKNKLEEVQRKLGAAFVGIPCDITNEEAVSEAFKTVIDDEGRIDGLVNNAGLGKFGPADQVTADDWDLQMNVNLRGVFLCTKAAIPVMKKQNAESGFGGHIVNISSVAALQGSPQISTYNATKYGLRGYSDALFKEVRQDGIKVSCLFPGSIQTDFFDTAGIPISANPMTPDQITSTLLHVLETPDNYLISEITMRPLRPKG